MNKRSGITLIALVITVIVLLILAGAAVSIGLSGDNLFAKANEAKTEWNEKVRTENSIFDAYKNYLEQDPNTIRIVATQNLGTVNFSVTVPGNKSIADATENEKLDTILAVMKKYQEVPDNYTREQIKADINQWATGAGITYEENLELILSDYYIEYVGEIPDITVTLGQEHIELNNDGYSFYPTADGTYKIIATTPSGKYGETTIDAVLLNSASLQTRVNEYRIFFGDEITTWRQFVNSKYNIENEYDVITLGTLGEYVIMHEGNGFLYMIDQNGDKVNPDDNITHNTLSNILARIGDTTSWTADSTKYYGGIWNDVDFAEVKQKWNLTIDENNHIVANIGEYIFPVVEPEGHGAYDPCATYTECSNNHCIETIQVILKGQ